MEDSTIDNHTNQVFAFVKENFTEIMYCLCTFLDIEVSFVILESTVLRLLTNTGSDILEKNLEVVFKKTINAEVCDTIKSLRRIGVFQTHFKGEIDERCTRFISKHTARNILNTKERTTPGNVSFLKADSRNAAISPEETIDFDAFWTGVLEKYFKLEADGAVRKSRRRIVFVIVISVLVVSFFGAAYIGSYRALTDGDITYGIAVRRLLSGIPLVFSKKGPEPEYLERTGYQTKEQLLNEHPGAFILLPPFIPEGYSATEFAYMTHSDGFTTAIDYNVTEFAFFTIEYAVRDEYDPFSYRILYYEYEIVNEGNVSYYLFKERNYGFTAAFFLDDIYVTIQGQKNYPGTDKANITSMISGIMSEYYGTVTD